MLPLKESYSSSIVVFNYHVFKVFNTIDGSLDGFSAYGKVLNILYYKRFKLYRVYFMLKYVIILKLKFLGEVRGSRLYIYQERAVTLFT